MKHEFQIDRVFVNHKEQKFKTPCPIFVGKKYIWPLLKHLKVRRAYLAWRLRYIKYQMIWFCQIPILERIQLFFFKESKKYNMRKYKP